LFQREGGGSLFQFPRTGVAAKVETIRIACRRDSKNPGCSISPAAAPVRSRLSSPFVAERNKGSFAEMSGPPIGPHRTRERLSQSVSNTSVATNIAANPDNASVWRTGC
jgi:hypothetical protein